MSLSFVRIVRYDTYLPALAFNLLLLPAAIFYKIGVNCLESVGKLSCVYLSRDLLSIALER